MMLPLCPEIIILYSLALRNLCHKSNLYGWIHIAWDFSGTVSNGKDWRMWPSILRNLNLLWTHLLLIKDHFFPSKYFTICQHVFLTQLYRLLWPRDFIIQDIIVFVTWNTLMFRNINWANSRYCTYSFWDVSQHS